MSVDTLDSLCYVQDPSNPGKFCGVRDSVDHLSFINDYRAGVVRVGQAGETAIAMGRFEQMCIGWLALSSPGVLVNDEAHDRIKEVLRCALHVAEWRDGDIDTEGGSFATTGIDQIIALQRALADLFSVDDDVGDVPAILKKIEAVL